MTIIVQQPKDSNGNPQPMVYDSDTGRVIVDHNGYVINGASGVLVNINAIGIESTKRTTVSGTTAGSIIASMPVQDNTYKKVLIYLDGYENDSTTAQTYTYPVAFTTVAAITSNSASVPGVSTSLTEFSIAPDTTTAYTGLIIIEGY